jgi:hypothetical protein
MEGGEAKAEVAWLTGWRATRDSSPQFLSCGHDEQEKQGGGKICSTSMHRENYEPKTVLVEPGVWPERARRKGATTTGELWARPALYTRVSSNQNGRERE